MAEPKLSRCEPAATVIERLGGPRAVADLAGVDLSRVTRWRLPKKKGGTGGVIPQRHIPALIDAARLAGLTAEDFLPRPPPSVPAADPAPAPSEAA